MSSFVSQGDYGFPSLLSLYLDKNFSLWSIQNGAPNLDGIIRTPGKFLTTLMYLLFGNIAASYFYLAFSYAIVALSSYLFLRFFLNIKSKITLVSLTLLFTLSPAFLGNTAKIGLVAAAALVLLSVLLIKYFFEKNKLRYLILLVICLNYSLIHPYTFVINACVSITYFLYLCFRVRSQNNLKPYRKNIILGVVLAILLNMYFILPVLNVGSISKSTLSQDTSTQQVDYSGIVDISNAGNSINALTQAKLAFIDFEYFDQTTKVIYSIAGISTISIIFILFILNKSMMVKKHKKMLVLSLCLFLILIFLSSGYQIASQIIKIFISMPGGWIFRSPLKWQLYLPQVILLILGLLSIYLTSKQRSIIMSILIILAVAQSGFLLSQIYTHLLKPKSISEFQKLSEIKNGKKLLYINGTNCAAYLNDHPGSNAEINQILNSKEVSVRRVSVKNINDVQVSEFNYIFLCNADTLSKEYLRDYIRSASFAVNSFQLYENKSYVNVESVSNLSYNSGSENVNRNSIFLNSLNIRYNSTKDSEYSGYGMVPLFSNISSNNIQNDLINTYKPLTTGLLRHTSTINYQKNSNDVDLYTKNNIDKNALESTQLKLLNNNVRMKTEGTIDNVVINGNFNNGLWNQSVQDCFNFDDDPRISMELKSENSNNYVNLSSGSHIACTTKSINVKNNSVILYGYKYRSGLPNGGGYSIRFNDKNRTKYSEDFNDAEINKWRESSILLRVPNGATVADITLYSNPGEQFHSINKTDFDDITAFLLPKDVLNYYVFANDDLTRKFGTASAKLLSKSNTHKKLTINDIYGESLLIKTGITYNQDWKVKLENNNKELKINKIPINNNELGIVIKTSEPCTSNCLLVNEPINIDISFTPQKYFVIGTVISVLTIFISFIYYLFHVYISRNKVKRTIKLDK